MSPKVGVSLSSGQSVESLVGLGVCKGACHEAIDSLIRASSWAHSPAAKAEAQLALVHAERALRVINRRVARVEAGR